MLNTVRAGLVAAYDPTLVDELLQAYVDTKKNFYLGHLRLSEVEGGRFCEAVLRMLQQRTTGKFAPLGKHLDTEKIIQQLGSIPAADQPDAVRLHIPRAVRMVYDIRNKRDAAHLADGIDPNVQDATLVVSVLDWVLAEFVRLHHAVPADKAQEIVENTVTRVAPGIQDFAGFLKVLNPALSSQDHVLVLLYQCGAGGATYAQLDSWARPAMRSNLRRTLRKLTDDLAYVHGADGRYHITATGQREVETRRLYRLP